MLKNIRDKLEKNGFSVYENSFRLDNGSIFFILKASSDKYLGVCSGKDNILQFGFTGQAGKDIFFDNEGLIIKLFKKNENNLKKILNIFPFIKPVPLNTNTSFGFGDRLGTATPGHIKAIMEYKNIFPVFAQQSVRELNHTKRKFKDVILDTIWNLLQEGYSGKWGADADHIKDKESFIDAVNAGFTMFTIDPSESLNKNVTNLDENELKNLFKLNSKYIKGFLNKYADKKHATNEFSLKFDENSIIKIGLTYQKALNSVSESYTYLMDLLNSFDFEISFDETDSITTPEAHYIIANEMHEMGVNFSSLALRFPGRFEKGIDYIGHKNEFEENIRINGAIAKDIGGYKLSLHSGSDKFSIYPIFCRHTLGCFHIKTSGTSWLEALHVASVHNPELFREIYRIAAENFDENKKHYDISLKISEIPDSINDIDNKKLPELIYNRKIRQPLHIAYGKILDERKEEIYNLLERHEQDHYKFVSDYLQKHLTKLTID